ncbi:MAG: M3 family oligoendopeptidase [Candidatus Poseidoniales archaeon]|nr:MAG: M3 family oligoendopeptidase [Candidatus Poseidoniales archaeon]|tara:strand:+ start:281 stop:2008 length:1728 start_codon:yes stop_codon:yes gene_type:complete
MDSNMAGKGTSSFVDDGFNPGDWDEIKPYVNKLLNRKISCSKCIEGIIRDASELSEHISEKGALLYIAMTCDTESDEKRSSFLDFVENVRPKLSEFSDSLNRRLIEHEAVKNLPSRYDLMIRSMKNDVDIFRKENIPLGVEQTKLVTESQTINGAMTVEFNGNEYTLPEMRRFLESNERAIREGAWKAVSDRRMQDEERLSEIFDELIVIRSKIARNAGFDTYTDYMFRAMERFDYSKEDCLEFHDAIEAVCVPLMREINSQRVVSLDLDFLMPWDVNEKTGVGPDLQERAPLKPFDNVGEMVEKLSTLFHNMSEDLGEKFDMLVEMDTLDLDTRKGKAPGGYQYYLQKSRVPFIFMNAAGLQGDLETMIHEAGHAFHSIYCSHLELIGERGYPIEFAEVASMSMELMTQEQWGEFYDEEEANRAKMGHLEGVIFLLPWIATIDSFQHWIYSNPEHTREERARVWNSIRDRFGSNMNWEEYTKFRDVSWQQQGHLFGVPFYYVEYGIAQLGALQLWRTQRKDPEKALSDYSNAMRLGNTKTLPELFTAADIKLGFDERHLSSLIQEVRTAMAELN